MLPDQAPSTGWQFGCFYTCCLLNLQPGCSNAPLKTVSQQHESPVKNTSMGLTCPQLAWTGRGAKENRGVDNMKCGPFICSSPDSV